MSAYLKIKQSAPPAQEGSDGQHRQRLWRLRPHQHEHAHAEDDVEQIKPVPEIINVITGQDAFYFPDEVVAGELARLIGGLGIEKMMLMLFSGFVYAA